MKHTLAILLLAFAGVAQAGPACWPKMVGGAGVGIVSGSLEGVGQYSAVWCPTPYTWRVQTFTALEGYSIKYPSIGDGMTVVQVLDAAWALNVTSPCADARLCEAAEAAAQATKPADPKWVVAKNGTSTTRPMWIVDLSLPVATFTASTLRAPVGATCDCVGLAKVKGTQTLCYVENIADDLAACTKAP